LTAAGICAVILYRRRIPTPAAKPPTDVREFKVERWQDPLDPRIEIDVPVVPREHPYFRIFCRRPTVRILFYTDRSDVAFNNASAFGVNRLRDLILDRNTFYVHFEIDLVNRHEGGHAANKLTSALLTNYDQVWFFGVQQANLVAIGGLPAEPENELTDSEVTDLRAWMDTGGVLITGDHANPRPPRADPGLNLLVNLGRAIGHRVPRAGELRRWEGPPDASIMGSHNTQVPVGVADINTLVLQEDATPQQLILKQYPLRTFLPAWLAFRTQPHPLFCGRIGPVEVFPDHMHEGQIEIPVAFPPSTWPSSGGLQPQPEVVAWGTDKRDGNVYPVVATYDGEPAGVSRIVADSTWHHYFNINLRGFPPGPTLDDIASYYVNLAVWLSPAPKREQMRCWIWWWIASESSVLMVRRNALRIIGGTALDVLGQVASQCVIVDFEDWPDLDPDVIARVPWPPDAVIVGGIVTEYHNAMELLDQGEGEFEPRDLIRRGLLAALREQIDQLSSTLDGARELLTIVEQLGRDEGGRRTT
jgi:hypothetical protein